MNVSIQVNSETVISVTAYTVIYSKYSVVTVIVDVNYLFRYSRYPFVSILVILAFWPILGRQ